MTETLARPAPPLPPEPVRGRSLVVAGVVTAARAAALGLLLVAVAVLLVWAGDERATVGSADALRTAAQVWLVAHGASLDLPAGRLSLTPLGLLVLPLLLLARATAAEARHRDVQGLRAARRLVVATALPYAVLAGLVSGQAATGAARATLGSALLAGAVTGAAGAGLGVLRTGGLLRGAWSALPARLRSVLPATATAVGVLVGGGALLVGGSLARHLGRASDLAAASGPGLAGGLALLVLGLALVPVAVVWGAAWLAGAGFAVGAGTAVGPFGAELGPVPALPLLAALPGGPLPTAVGVLALAVPLLAGALAGLVHARRGPDLTPLRAGLRGLVVGPCAGLVLGLLAWLSAGAAGGQRLAELGPSAGRVAVLVTLEVGLAAAATAALRARRRTAPAPA